MATKRLSASASAKKAVQLPQSNDTRQLMRQNVLQKRMTGAKRVDHPLARYNKLDQLSCAICLIPLKNEASWTAHLLSKTHKESVEKFKRGEKIVSPVSKGNPSSQSASTNNPESETPENMEEDVNECSNNSDEVEGPPSKLSKPSDELTAVASNLPDDFFDSVPTSSKASDEPVSKKRKDTDKEEPSASTAATTQLPEGFFDDAKRDAKARQVKYVDKYEDVWNEFQKEIAKETQVSRAIVEEDEDKLFISRDVDEIDEEIERWARVEALHNKRESQKSEAPSKMDTSAESSTANKEDESSGEDEDFSIDGLNWRQKKF